MNPRGFSAFSRVITHVPQSNDTERSYDESHHGFAETSRLNAPSLVPWWKARPTTVGLSPTVWSYYDLQHSPYLRFAQYASYSREKPSQSYIGLIAEAILSSPELKLILSDIYGFVLANYPYFRAKGTGWRNSIRHNLSLNDCFVKAGRSPNGKGHFWAIDPMYFDDFRRGDFRRRRSYKRSKGKKSANTEASEDVQSTRTNTENVGKDDSVEVEDKTQVNTTSSETWGNDGEEAAVKTENTTCPSPEWTCVDNDESKVMEKYIDLSQSTDALKEISKVKSEPLSPITSKFETFLEQPSDKRLELNAVGSSRQRKKTGYDVESLLAPDDRVDYPEQHYASSFHPIYRSVDSQQGLHCTATTSKGVPSLYCDHCYPMMGTLAPSQRDMRYLYKMAVDGSKMSLPQIAYKLH